mmetsp:Transcript_13623/g.20740  ORF Transcript_13623/g.20740 Transcript_13623/m.20740 type:complete len:214 (-) Transcript_13623:133-774(-)|eukprot:CAMPEP_0178918778 /NCGR_PEP_ID=MMETSP0786-20121207/14020_1 /TAXON_ID=186022 /ORGANISM="Thalassionema frauenfeldii, Strain CCMP 1798" /LENGTH=213 /DNA_ID=CAMNT_0020592535 /DNA_START=93 /DNA_END=734 /DNA_ORIENTATION=+
MESHLDKQIQKYQSALRSRKYIYELNRSIHTTIPSAESLTEYYQSHPELADYTIDKELPRMKYTVWTREGTKLIHPSDISAYYNEEQQTADVWHNDFLLWRSANQSILGDVISAMTSPKGLVRPQLKAATFVKDVSVTMDFKCIDPHVRVECFLNISLPDSKGQSLLLAGALVMAYFCPSRNKFNAGVTKVFPCKSLTQEEVDRAAASILVSG